MVDRGRGSRRHLGRGADGEVRVRDLSYRLRLSVEERHQLRLRAAAAGVTMSRFLVDSALGVRVTPYERQALYTEWGRVAGRLGKLGANLNQLAYWSNVHQEAHGQAGVVAGEVHELAAELRVLAEKIVKVV